MARAFPSAMNSIPSAPSPAAVAAFLRGLDKRARLFAGVQAGDATRGDRALAAVLAVACQTPFQPHCMASDAEERRSAADGDLRMAAGEAAAA